MEAHLSGPVTGLKPIKWQDSHVVHRIQYEDGTGDLCDMVFKEPEGLEITGNGSCQAPLTVVVKPTHELMQAGAKDALEDALSFIRGFEDDELQEGIPELIGRLERAIAPIPSQQA